MIFTIIALAFLLRIVNLSQLFHFTMDEALIAFRAFGLFELNRPFLIGGISPLQVHLPPYFYYLASALLLPFKFNPLGWGYWAAGFSLITVYLLYKYAKSITNKKTALIASLLYAASFQTVFFDRHFWPLFFNPIYTLLTLWFLPKLTKKHLFPFIALAVVLVMAITSDPSNIPLLLLTLLFIYSNRKKIPAKSTLISTFTAFGLFFAPLLAFDLRHNWQNFSGVQKLFQTASSHQFAISNLINSVLLIPKTFVRFFYTAQTNLVELYSYCIPYTNQRLNLPIILVLISVLVLTWFFIKSKFKTIKSLILLYLLGITVFGSLGFSLFDHYLTGLTPVFAIIAAYLLSKLPKKLIPVFVSIFVFFNLYQFNQAFHPYSLQAKRDLIAWTSSKLQNQSFALDSISKCHKENGLRYLFELTDNPPTISFMDPNFFWLYQTPPAQSMPDKVLLVSDKSLNLDQPIIDQNCFDGVKIYLLDNSDQSYQIKY